MYLEKVWTAWRVDRISVVMFCWQMRVPCSRQRDWQQDHSALLLGITLHLGLPMTQSHTAVFLLTVCLCLCLEEQSCSGPVLSLTGELLDFAVGP